MRTRVKSESAEGTYYLVNGWNKYRAFWYKDSLLEKHPYLKERTFFKSIGYAKGNLTKLLKIMPEYKDDKFTFIEE